MKEQQQETIELDPNSPTGIRGVKTAKLPALYSQARQALAKCTKVDEAKEFGSKAAALAAFAKMKDDKEMERMFTEVRKWAKRRWGELNALIENKRGRPSNEQRKLGGTPPNKKPTAREREQAKEAKRFAAVPEDKFAEAVKQGKSDTAIAEMGKRKKEKPWVPPPPPAFNEKGEPDPKSPAQKEATKLLAFIDRTKADGKSMKPKVALEAMTKEEKAEFSESCFALGDWFVHMGMMVTGE